MKKIWITWKLILIRVKLERQQKRLARDEINFVEKYGELP